MIGTDWPGELCRSASPTAPKPHQLVVVFRTSTGICVQLECACGHGGRVHRALFCLNPQPPHWLKCCIWNLLKNCWYKCGLERETFQYLDILIWIIYISWKTSGITWRTKPYAVLLTSATRAAEGNVRDLKTFNAQCTRERLLRSTDVGTEQHFRHPEVAMTSSWDKQIKHKIIWDPCLPERQLGDK